jgi:hypothetical protein
MNPAFKRGRGPTAKEDHGAAGNSELEVGLGNQYALYFVVYKTLQSDQLHERRLSFR